MKEKKSKPIKAIANSKAIPELKDLVKGTIDEIINAASFLKPIDLAETYLQSKEAFPLPLRSSVEVFLRAPSKKTSKSTEKKSRKSTREIQNDFFEKVEQMRARISKKTLEEFNKKYDKETIDKILEALIDFEPYVAGTYARMNVVNYDLRIEIARIKKKYNKIINATDVLLKGATLSDSEREVIRRVQRKYQGYFERLSQIREVTIDKYKEVLLNLGASRGLFVRRDFLDPKTWIGQYFLQCCTNFVPKKPQGRPKTLFFNTLVIVIYRLLENKSEQIKWRYGLTADIVNQCFCNSSDKLTLKSIDNILHST